MTVDTGFPVRARMLQWTFNALPVPGRYLAPALRMAGINPSSLPSPILCRDRWRDFSVEIRSAADIIERHILFQGYFEYQESLFIRRLLKPGDLFVDIGANIGWHSMLAAARVGSTGRVVAFEPATQAFLRLTRNIDLNRFTQIEAFHFGLSDRDAVFDIYPCEEANSGANSLYGAGTPIERVQVRPGDEVVNELGISAIDLCKIDVEGAELDVLAGLTETLRKRLIRALMIEINPESLTRAGRSADELIAMLAGHGFQLHEVRSRRRVRSVSDLREGLNVIGRIS